MLCRSRTRGYSLKLKKWLDFFVEQVAEIEWNTDAFDRLVLPQDQKELILAFSESQLGGAGAGFDDVVAGKGRGIICLLSGPPGVGKTLTAEAVAESLQVPLHTISSGDLGSQPWEVERGLSRILDLVARWRAILLLDECDVFLEARSAHDLERNKVVSIFLRTLEYYEGIMFMTTNRADNMDAAFQSRIHVSLAYPDLTADSRPLHLAQLHRRLAHRRPERRRPRRARAPAAQRPPDQEHPQDRPAAGRPEEEPAAAVLHRHGPGHRGAASGAGAEVIICLATFHAYLRYFDRC